MNEQLPKCKLCGSEAVATATRDGVYSKGYTFYSCDNKHCGLDNAMLDESDWRTLHDQSRCAELEAKVSLLEAAREFDGDADWWEGDHPILRLAKDNDRLKAESATLRERVLDEAASIVETVSNNFGDGDAIAACEQIAAAIEKAKLALPRQPAESEGE